jgi:hypothetical protein
MVTSQYKCLDFVPKFLYEVKRSLGPTGRVKWTGGPVCSYSSEVQLIADIWNPDRSIKQ